MVAWGWLGGGGEFPCLKTITIRSQSEDDSFSCSKGGLEKGKGEKCSLSYIALYDRFSGANAYYILN